MNPVLDVPDKIATAYLELCSLLGREVADGNLRVEWAKLAYLGHSICDSGVRVYVTVEANGYAVLAWVCRQNGFYLQPPPPLRRCFTGRSLHQQH